MDRADIHRKSHQHLVWSEMEWNQLISAELPGLADPPTEWSELVQILFLNWTLENYDVD